MPRKVRELVEAKTVDNILYIKCNHCKEFKTIDNYYKHESSTYGVQKWCKACSSKYSKERNTKEKNRESTLRKYGMIEVDYNILYLAQQGKCYICGEFREILDVDHCHITNKNRKLLCNFCNVGLGNFRDRIDLLEKALNYLKEFV